MIIQLSDDQVRTIKEFVSKQTNAEVDADADPGGYELLISVGPEVYGVYASVKIGKELIELGEVEICS